MMQSANEALLSALNTNLLQLALMLKQERVAPGGPRLHGANRSYSMSGVAPMHDRDLAVEAESEQRGQYATVATR